MAVLPPRPRDFVELPDGGLGAVLTWPTAEGRVLAAPRYGRGGDQPWRKVEGTPLECVPTVIHRPEQALASLLAYPRDGVAAHRAAELARALAARGVPLERLGVTGSLLVGAERFDSDIDLVAYGRPTFGAARAALAALIAEGTLAPLGPAEWEQAWHRRAPEIPLADYVAHERRKGTKALIGRTRIDLSLVPDDAERRPEVGPFRKLGLREIEATVRDDAAGFDYPAWFGIEHPEVEGIAVFTATYFGQARAGERLRARGWLEEDGLGRRRLLVGTSRAAPGEWIVSLDVPRAGPA